MKFILCCFAAERYWKDRKELELAYAHISNKMRDVYSECYLVDDGFDLSKLSAEAEDVLIALPMSGAVQPNIINAAHGGF